MESKSYTSHLNIHPYPPGHIAGSPEGVTPSSSTWIGAWWLGYLILGVANLFLAVCFILFPKSIRHRIRLFADTSGASLTGADSMNAANGSQQSINISHLLRKWKEAVESYVIEIHMSLFHSAYIQWHMVTAWLTTIMQGTLDLCSTFQLLLFYDYHFRNSKDDMCPFG